MPRSKKSLPPDGLNIADDYVIRVLSSPQEIDASAWDGLLALQPEPGPFMRHAYLAALHSSGSATPQTGWLPQIFTVWTPPRGDAGNEELQAACVLYVKNHSYGEYVFDWAWANAYQKHGLDYYPKAVVAVPFTPVPGARLMARDDTARKALLAHVLDWCRQHNLSSLHLLFVPDYELAACTAAGLMERHTVQFHWKNVAPYKDFEEFLAALTQEKRKKIRQERRKVAEAGVRFRWSLGADISTADWDFFYRCYERTYLEHGNAPYLSRDFFHRMASTMAEHWLLFIAERNDQPIASSLIALGSHVVGPKVAYGRYWGALERVDCLHFEACYYQPLQWCIEHGFDRFEGGAQGEHKMARALMPVRTHSAHWVAHPGFADAVGNFLQREDAGIDDYLSELARRSPLRQAALPDSTD